MDGVENARFLISSPIRDIEDQRDLMEHIYQFYLVFMGSEGELGVFFPRT
jgi:hypothetical protein